MTTSEEGLAPGEVELIVKYGECTGYCTTILRVSGRGLILTRVSDVETDPDLHAVGEASEEWASGVREALERVSKQSLESVYGKPDSRDEGAATVRIVRDGSVTEHSFSATDPPAPISELHTMLVRVLHAWVDGEAIPGFELEFHPPP